MTPEQIAASGSESAHQKAVFAWAALNLDKYPMLAFMHAIPNGGKRDAMTAARMKAEGVRAGVPDIFLPWPVYDDTWFNIDEKGNVTGGKWSHGLYIEMKTKGGKISDNQKIFIDYLNNNNYEVVICYDYKSAITEIESYLNVLYREKYSNS